VIYLRRREMQAKSGFRSAYTLGAAIVWAGIFLAIAFILSDANTFMQILPVLGGGAVWFVVIVPGALARQRGLSDERR
jgi:hypothetical protein